MSGKFSVARLQCEEDVKSGGWEESTLSEAVVHLTEVPETTFVVSFEARIPSPNPMQ